MAARTTSLSLPTVTETAATNLNIMRSVVGGGAQGYPNVVPTLTLPTVIYNVNMSYADTEYAVDAQGVKIRVLGTTNPSQISLTQERVMTLFSRMITPEGSETPIPLGEYLANLMDEEINLDLDAKEAAANSTPTPAV